MTRTLFVLVAACELGLGRCSEATTAPVEVVRECKGRTALGTARPFDGSESLTERLAAARAYRAIAAAHLEARDWSSAEFCANSGISAIDIDEPARVVFDDRELHRLYVVDLQERGAPDEAARHRVSMLEGQIIAFESYHRASE